MIVRWKPLLILSGLFVVIAVVGLAAMAYTLVPRSSADILPVARAERSAKRFDNALVHYRRALQQDGKNAGIYEEMAAMFAEWAENGPGPEEDRAPGTAADRAGRCDQVRQDPERAAPAAARRRHAAR